MQASQESVGAGQLGAELLVSVKRAPKGRLSPWCSSPWKRGFDLVVTSLFLTVAWPVFLLVAAAVKMSSSGPALFRQKRVGKDGKEFELMKFRSMRVAADRSGPGITCANDPRVFPLGRLLRRWKVDELPQLFNVMRGDMSLVGPRPDLPEFCAALDKDQRHVLELRPGVTGAATLVYRDEERILGDQGRDRMVDYYVTRLYPEKVRLDLEYAGRASLANDLRIITRTVAAIFS